MIPIALIDDHPLVANAIGEWLCSTGRFSILWTAGNLTEARSLIAKSEDLPRIIILDVSLGKEDGLLIIPELKKFYKQHKANGGILVYSMHEDPFTVQRAMDLGAAAYVAKSAESGEILTAINAVLAGDIYVSAKTAAQEQPNSSPPALTRRENEIASLVKQSLTTGQIAERLNLSIRTVESHLAHIYQKTGVASRSELFKL